MSYKQRTVQPSSTTWLETTYNNGSSPDKRTISVGGYSESIEYDDGPRKRDGHCVWKKCHHIRTSTSQVVGAPVYWRGNSVIREAYQCPVSAALPSGHAPSVPPDMAAQLQNMIVNQFDLNCSDSVLLYSGVLQAVPLVGGAFKFVKIMNEVGRSLSKSFKKRPFTTVLKTAISLDFINRFVVQTTIDDARKFINAHNYVINVMNTVSERNQSIYTPLVSELRRTISSSRRTFSNDGSAARNINFSGYDLTLSDVSIKEAIIAKLSYDVTAISPIRLWADRLGITKPLDSVWDLVPFSFVVDYFTRAGDFIAELGQRVSSQEGLRGRLGQVYAHWSMATTRRVVERYITGARALYGTAYGFAPQKLTVGEVVFDRAPGSFAELSRGLLAPERGLIINAWSTKKAKTIAELLLQAKLR